MSLVITNIQRINPAPCGHFLLTVNEDGEAHTVQIGRDSFSQDFDDPKLILVLLWMRYKVANGATLPSLIGQTVV